MLAAVVRHDGDEAVRIMGDDHGYGGAASQLTDLLLDWVREVESDSRVHDLSATGLSGTADGGLDLAPGTNVHVDLPHNNTQLRMSGQVVRDDGRGGIAVQFTANESALAGLQRLLAEQATTRR